MSVSELEKIERDLGITFPENYKQAHVHFNELIADYGLSEAQREEIARCEIICDSGQLRSLNDSVRGAPAEWTDEIDNWPDQLWVIGETGGGDYWYIDVEDPASSVGFYNHELAQFEWEYPSVERLVAVIATEYKNDT